MDATGYADGACTKHRDATDAKRNITIAQQCTRDAPHRETGND